MQTRIFRNIRSRPTIFAWDADLFAISLAIFAISNIFITNIIVNALTLIGCIFLASQLQELRNSSLKGTLSHWRYLLGIKDKEIKNFPKSYIKEFVG